MFQSNIAAAPPEPAPSRFARIGPWPARAILLFLALLVALALVQPPAPVPATDGTATDRADVMLYEDIVRAVRSGEGYYTAAAEAHRAGSYPLRPFVTMRPPTVAFFQSLFPTTVALRAAFLALLASMLVAWHRRFAALEIPGPQPLVGTLLVATGCMGLAVPELLAWHEAWAALLIALSLALRSKRRFALSVAVGLAAVLVREIAVLYPLTMCAAAALERRPREALAWLAALLAFAAFMLWHAANVAAVTRPDDLASPGWAAVGGWRFVVTMMWLTGPLRSAPLWIGAVLVPLSLLGWAGWRSAVGLRGALLLAGYAVTFAMLGRPDNFYWAFLVAPLVPLGLLLAPASLRDLARAASGLDARPVAPAAPSL